MRAFAVLLAVLFAVSPAYAGSNIKQKDTGATVWSDQNSIDVPIGSSGLVVGISDLATSATVFVVTHKPGRVIKAYVVRNRAADAASDSSILTVYIAKFLTSTTQFTPISIGAELTTATPHDGAISSMSPAYTGVEAKQGSVIAVHTDGGETCSGTVGCEANVTIVIE
jgi:hypothetical protein